MTGTTSDREPSLRTLSTASPRCAGPATRAGLPSSVRAKCVVIAGLNPAARAMAYPIRWVKETLPALPPAARAVFSWRRRLSNTPTPMVRNDVAVGMSRLRSM